MKNKYFILFAPLILVLAFDYYFIFIKKEEIEEPLVDNEPICHENCKEGDKVLLSDGSSWHIIQLYENKLTLFSDATIDANGNYLPVDTFSTRNTGVPFAFDKQYERSTETNPYCIFSDLGCSAYEKNGKDVLEDSNVKKIIDSQFLPKLIQTFKTDDVVVRLLKQNEFEHFKALEKQNNTRYKWLYYSDYWLETPYNNYSLMVLKAKNEELTISSAYIHHIYGIRPVIEVDYNIVL